MRKLIFLSGIFSVLLASCGGSSNCEGSALLLGAIPSASCQNSKDGGSEIKTGKFLDSAVIGLTYQTPTQSGTTNANGEFTYKAGEVVQFKLFGITIGSATGDEVMTPTSIAPSTGSGDFPINVLRLLQTVDTDSDPTNGITLPSTLAYPNLSFDKSKNDFETSSTSAASITQVVCATLGVNTKFPKRPDGINSFAKSSLRNSPVKRISRMWKKA